MRQFPDRQIRCYPETAAYGAPWARARRVRTDANTFASKFAELRPKGRLADYPKTLVRIFANLRVRRQERKTLH